MKDKDNGAVGMRRSGPGWLVYLGKVAEWLEHLPPNPGGRWVDTRVTQQIFSYSTGCLTGTWLRRVLGKVGRRESGTEREKNQRKGKGCYGNYSIYVYHNKKVVETAWFLSLAFLCLHLCLFWMHLFAGCSLHDAPWDQMLLQFCQFYKPHKTLRKCSTLECVWQREVNK